VIDDTDVYARLSPAHKKRVVQALQKKGHVVGFMGDGINDAPALRAADVGISVDTAVDIAKESADMILLEKSLMVLEEGVLEGRKVFATSPNTSAWAPVPISAICSVCSAPARGFRFCDANASNPHQQPAL